jgi:hypothetical protein
VVFASGGDGTLNEVINGIVGSEASLGVIRAGTATSLARKPGCRARSKGRSTCWSTVVIIALTSAYAEGPESGAGGDGRRFFC